jgi:hypothetical protein
MPFDPEHPDSESAGEDPVEDASEENFSEGPADGEHAAGSHTVKGGSIG